MLGATLPLQLGRRLCRFKTLIQYIGMRPRYPPSLMPLYHIEVRTPTHVMLTEGAELNDHTAARVEAARRTGLLLNDYAGQVWASR